MKSNIRTDMCNDKQNKDNPKSQLRFWIIVAIMGVIALWGLSWLGISKFIDNPTNQGTFGDMFGAVNALFSGLAFAGLIVTLIYQKEELKLQRDELAETRKELQGQREEFEEQNKTLKRQRFESTFFNMLSLQQEIIASLSYENPIQDETKLKQCDVKHRIYKSRDIFEGIYTDAIIDYDGKLCYGGIKSKLADYGCLAYTQIKGLSFLDHYFRHLYRVIKYVDTSDSISDDERYDYVCIVRSQLSDYELVMLFYNCLTANGKAKFKPLIEKYSIFNNLRDDLLADIEHKNEYTEKAYNKYAE